MSQARGALGALLAAAIALTGCAAAQPPREAITLSYPQVANDALRFEGYQALAQRVSGAYVRVLVFQRTRGRGATRRRIVNGASGTIVDRLGYLVTAAHIAKHSEFDAEVTTMDGRVRPGRIVHVDPGRELAVLKIEPYPGMQVATMADSRRLRRGQRVIGIGTPNNRAGVVTPGRIRKSRRSQRIVYAEYGYEDAVELRMAVEPGYSGGPVFDASGRLVGVLASFGLGNTRRVPYVSTQIAYAVPSGAISAYLGEVMGR